MEEEFRPLIGLQRDRGPCGVGRMREERFLESMEDVLKRVRWRRRQRGFEGTRGKKKKNPKGEGLCEFTFQRGERQYLRALIRGLQSDGGRR